MTAKRAAIFKHGRDKQRGAALLIMLVILVIGIAVVFVNSLTSSRMKTVRQENTAAFARLNGLAQLSATIAAQLMEENRSFRTRWMKVMEAGI